MRKKFFANTPKTGDPIAKRGLARALAAMDHAWATLDVLGGHVDWSHGSPTIVVEAGGSGGVFNVRGDEGLFKIIALRAYLKSDNSIVAPETAFNASTMYLHPTWDYERWP